jgi:hypothetical protein
MSGFKIKQGIDIIDLDDIFVLGTASISDTGYKVGGTDIKTDIKRIPVNERLLPIIL